jgi:hypothetical protein
MNRYLVLTVLLLVSLAGTSFAREKSKTYGDTVKLLSKAFTEVPNDALAKLFSIGDTRLDDLKDALDEKDKSISLEAQRILRYLGSPEAISVLQEYFDRPAGEKSIAGAIPIPISEFDYKVHLKSDWMSAEFIYALMFDGSPQAQSILPDLFKKGVAISNGCTGPSKNNLSHFAPSTGFSAGSDLADSVVRNAFFICESDRKYVYAKFIAYNAAKTKAFIYLKIDRGPLAEEWYHIIVSKSENRWRFFSVTQVAVS